MTERKILVAKSYQGLPFESEPYVLNGKEYIKVRMKNGSIKQVRSYSSSEYSKYYPEVKIIQPAVSRRDVLGFGDAGYIWLFKGLTHDATYESLDWFRASPCRFARPWGWYLPSDIEMPNPLPVNVEPVKLYWDEVSLDDKLISEDQITKIVDSILYDAGESRHIGNIGDRIEFDGICTYATINQSQFGISYFFVFQSDGGNIFTWGTSTRMLNKGTRYHIKGTVSGHTIYHNNCQTVLKRCQVEKI